MVEQQSPVLGKEDQNYEQLFGQSNIDDVEQYEKFDGTIQEGIDVLEAGLKDKKTSVYIPAFRSYELMKFSINEEIEIDVRKIREEQNTAFDAARLAQEIALSCYCRDNETALKNLKQFKNLIQNSGQEDSHLERMLKRRVDEKPDLAFLPSCLDEEDFNIAKKMLKDAKGKPVLMMGVGWRGAWRLPEIFSEYVYLSDTPNTPGNFGSKLEIKRYSPDNYHDVFPRYSVLGIDYVQEEAENRTIVVVGAIERLPRFTEHLVKVVLPGQVKASEIIQIPLKLTNANGNDGNGTK